MQNITKEWKQPVVILQQANFYNILFLLVAKNHQKMRSRCLDHEFSFTYNF